MSLVSQLKHKKPKVRLANLLASPAWIYALISTIGVVGFALITPPFQGPDESFHFIRAQYVAHGYFLPADAKSTGASLPMSIREVINETFPKDGIVGKPWEKYDLVHTKASLKRPLDAAKTYQPAMINYTGAPYLPAVPAIVVSNVLNFSPLISMYLARLSIGFASIAIIFAAIRLIPYKKYLLMTIALTPMMLFQQSMVSIDGISYALLILFISYVLSLHKQAAQPSNRQWLFLGALCVAIVLAKPLIYLFLPLVILLVKKKYAVRWISIAAIACVITLAGLTAYNASKKEAVIDSNTPTTTNSSMQISNIEHHPKRFLRVMWNTYMTEYGDQEVTGVIGIFGPADTKYPLWMLINYVVIIGLFTFASIRPEDIANIPSWFRVLAVIIAAAYFVLVNLAIYISFSPVDFNIVYGVQGRYFLPILLILPLLVTPLLTIKSKKDTQRFVGYSTLVVGVLVLLALFTVLQRYYLYTA